MASARSSIGGGAAWAVGVGSGVRGDPQVEWTMAYADSPMDREELTVMAQTRESRAADMMSALEQAYHEGAAAGD